MAVMLTRWPPDASPAPGRAARPEPPTPPTPPPGDTPIHDALVREWSRAGRTTPRTAQPGAPGDARG